MSNEVKIDLSKLSLEELEKIKFLMPVAVEAEIASRAVYETELELYEDAYESYVVMKELFEKMKSCPTKRTIADSNVIPFLEKVLATADKHGKDYKNRYNCKINNCVMKPVEVNADIVEQENAIDEATPAPVQEVAPEVASEVAPAPAPEAAPVTNGNDMANIMAMAKALAAQQGN